MKITKTCEACLYRQQQRLTDDAGYLAEVQRIIDARAETDSAPYLVYLFTRAYVRRFGEPASYREIKKKYNDMMLAVEDTLRRKIEAADDPVVTAFLYARVGNYIDFAAMERVEEDVLLSLFDEARLQDGEAETMASFLRQCETARRFLLIADNCGEIVLDKLLFEQLHRRFPQMKQSIMVRGGEAFNDVTEEDAAYVAMPAYVEVISNGLPLGGTVYELLAEPARLAVDGADVILSKGQGNYETLGQRGRHVFYSFLCKCEQFTEQFAVPQFTGIFLEERG